MEKEIQNIAFQLDNEKGRITKMRILKCLAKNKKNAHEIKGFLKMSSYSHVVKFLGQLYDLCLVDFEQRVCSNGYMNYVMKEWYLTDLGIEFIKFFKDVSLLREVTPKMFLEKLKRQIRNTQEYKNWREEVLKQGDKKCKICEVFGDSIQAHHIVPFSELLEIHKIDSVEKAIKTPELFDVKNGECLCSYHHMEEHNKN